MKYFFFAFSIIFAVHCKHAEVVESDATNVFFDVEASLSRGVSLEKLEKIAKGTYLPRKDEAADIKFELRDVLVEHLSDQEDEYQHKSRGRAALRSMREELGYPTNKDLKNHFEKGPFDGIKIYTNESKDNSGNQNYQRINSELRASKDLKALQIKNPEIHDWVTQILMSINKIPVFRGLVFRGSRLSNRFIEQIIKTKSFQDKAFLSSSLDYSDAVTFAKKPTTAEATKVYMVLYSKTGAFIPFGPFAREEEVLFKPQTLFKLNYHFYDVSDEGDAFNAYYLFLEEVE